MSKRNEAIYRQRSSLWIWIIGVCVAVIGCLMIFVTEYFCWLETQGALKVVVRQLGSILLVSPVVALIWKLFAMRVFLDEILLKTRLSRDIEFSGIIQVTDSFHTDIDWANYIRNTNKIDIFFAYGQTWRNTHLLDMRSAAQSKDIRIRVVLPDPESEATINELARRFSYTPNHLKKLIHEAAEYFKKLVPETSGSGAKVEIWFLPDAPTFTFYRFDNIAILALYTHRKERVEVPTFVCKKGGNLYDYLRHEFSAMIEGTKPLARKSV